MRKWTKKEDDFLKIYYQNKDIDSLSLALERTNISVISRAKKLKLTKNRTYIENMCRLEDAFDNGLYYKYLDFAKKLDSSIEYVTDAWKIYGKNKFELMYKEQNNG